MSDFLTCISGSQLAATQSSVTRPLSTTVKPERRGGAEGGERGDSPAHPKQGDIQRVKLQKFKRCR